MLVLHRMSLHPIPTRPLLMFSAICGVIISVYGAVIDLIRNVLLCSSPNCTATSAFWAPPVAPTRSDTLNVEIEFFCSSTSQRTPRSGLISVYSSLALKTRTMTPDKCKLRRLLLSFASLFIYQSILTIYTT